MFFFFGKNCKALPLSHCLITLSDFWSKSFGRNPCNSFIITICDHVRDQLVYQWQIYSDKMIKNRIHHQLSNHHHHHQFTTESHSNQIQFFITALMRSPPLAACLRMCYSACSYSTSCVMEMEAACSPVC